MLTQLDYQIFQWINHLAVTFSFLNPLMIFLADYGEYCFYLGVIIYWFTRTPSNRRMVAQGLVSACIALGTNAFIGLFLYRDRPFVDHHAIQLIQHAANASFPSDHATGAFVIATSVWLWRKRDGWLWLLLAVGVAFSRIWTGVHYPMDVVTGVFIGVLLANAIHVLLPRSKRLTRLLNQSIQLYEKIEQRVWKCKNEYQTR